MAAVETPLQPDWLTADVFSALGDRPVLLVDAAAWRRPEVAVQSVVVGLDAAGVLPAIDPAGFDILITSAAGAPAPWVSVAQARFADHAARLEHAVRQSPMAATVLCRVLRLAERLPFEEALHVESLAYSTLLGGGEFERWLAQRGPPAPVPVAGGPLVAVERHGDRVEITLDHPASRNALTAAMRDALCEALANALDDPSAPEVLLKGAGRCFSSGGDIGEFGTARDLALAHVVRTLRSPALLLDQLGPRATVRLHGACIGSGLEVPAAAHRRLATADAWFQLPELAMGLIPGAGGTVSVARAIGRHRTAWLVLSGQRIGAGLARDWGLIDEIVG
ncbi:MAG: enoyl-CoA hydratase/isomerase family protein [Novosphingobium sp.]|nr:enoyl-CoA hydratase/isomerase family protein [Novosphingobium sp.]